MPMTPPSQSSSSSSSTVTNELDTANGNISRQPGSIITFASFDPATATNDFTNAYAFRKLSLNEELCRPKRVVIETTPDGQCTWRFVPKARWEEGVENEGAWPRVVDVCGTLMTLTHDQWDKYKLDRNFDCLVRLSPDHPIIIKSTRQPSVDLDPPRKPPHSPLHSKNVRFKRRLSDNTSSRRLSGSNSDGMKKKRRAITSGFSSSSESESSDDDNEAEEDEVNGMIIDDVGVPKKHLQSERLKKVRANIEEARRKRREWNAQKRTKPGLSRTLEEEEEDEYRMSWTEIPSTFSTRAQSEGTPAFKRKGIALSDESNIDRSDSERGVSKRRFKTYEKNGTTKRTRTVSPGTAKRAIEARRNRRGDKRKEELDRRAKNRAQARIDTEMKKLYEEVAKSQPPPMQSTNRPLSPDEEMGEEAQRQTMLEESKRKIAELEKDRCLWEEQARRRAAQEAEEKAHAEAACRARAASQAAAAEQEKQREKQTAEEKAQNERDAAAAAVRTKRAEARIAARRDARVWLARGWTTPRALERYKQLCDAFDKLNFIKGDVVVFETIPWPVLLRPGSFGVEDVDWTAVETFFLQVRTYMPTKDYVTLVEKSHKRFHPDRWRSRRVLQCVEEEEEKECMEVAANTVAQALTPLWQDVTGR
ncbi:hypothetical protein DFH11DRAFT_1686161 [Phellopilus nigrolimitatus]|nr:hypothetical protein DFH11DRAFT_1686161 [Phellopilus nigrolimitatus]